MFINFKCNKIDYNKLYICNTGGNSIIIALSNNKDIPTILCKMYKINKLKFVVFNNINEDTYNSLIKDNLISKTVCIQTINTPNNKFDFTYTYNYLKSNDIFYNKLYYYEISGICTLNNIFELWKLIDFKYYDFIINLIDLFINKSTLLTTKHDLIHRDSHLNNIMFKNNYTLYLFDIFYKFKHTNPNKNEYKEYLKILKKLIFKNKEDKEHTDLILIKKYNITTFTPINKSYDILFIDLDNITSITNILKFTNKYNKNNKKVQNIITLIVSVLIYIDKLYFLKSTITLLTSFEKNNLNPHQNLFKIINYINTLYINIIDDIINKSIILQNIKNKQVITNLIWDINKYFIKSRHNNLTQDIFDTLFNFLYKEYYLNNDYDIILSFNTSLSVCDYLPIPYSSKEEKEVFI